MTKDHRVKPLIPPVHLKFQPYAWEHCPNVPKALAPEAVTTTLGSLFHCLITRWWRTFLCHRYTFIQHTQFSCNNIQNILFNSSVFVSSKRSIPPSSQQVEILINFYAFSKFLLKFCLAQPDCNITFNVPGFVPSSRLLSLIHDLHF